MMFRKDGRADSLVQLYLSFFSLSKVICLAPRVTKETFQSIVQPVGDVETAYSFVCEMKNDVRKLFLRYVPQIPSILLNQGLEFTPTWKDLPSMGETRMVIHKENGIKMERLKNLTSIFLAFPFEFACFSFYFYCIASSG